VLFWESGRGVLYNYATAMRAPASMPVWRVLDYCAEWRSVAAIAGHLGAGLDRRQVQRLIDALVSAGFVCVSGRRPDAREQAMEQWAPWNPSAGFFHTASRQCFIGEQAWFDRRLQAKAVDRPMPASMKPPAPERVSLAACRPETPLGEIVLDRRTFRQFGRARIRLSQLVEMLRLTSGVTHWLTVPHLGEVPLRSSPSGGARHPIETYVVAAGVEDLDRGTYRYAPDRHELDVVSRGTTRAQLRAFLPRQPWFAQCGAMIFFTAVFERTAWRYEFPRAYRAVLLEAGHMCQTFLLSATALGLAPFCTMAMDDVRVERHLRINGVDEAVLYAAGVGTRPADAPRVVLPAGRSLARVRPNTTP
jgi:SagB-type dehydrogenase family enzyme